MTISARGRSAPYPAAAVSHYHPHGGGEPIVLRLRVFVSSPGDVGAERGVALAVAERLQFEFRGQIQLETYLWERSLLRATDTFQAQILDIQEADLALFIL